MSGPLCHSFPVQNVTSSGYRVYVRHTCHITLAEPNSKSRSLRIERSLQYTR